jgi:hypothetical protein
MILICTFALFRNFSGGRGGRRGGRFGGGGRRQGGGDSGGKPVTAADLDAEMDNWAKDATAETPTTATGTT